MPDNTLRVSAEFDVGPIVAGAKAAVSAMDQMNAALKQVAVDATNSGNALLAQAARIMASGLTVKETASALQNLGTNEKDATLAANQAAAAVGASAVAFQTQAATSNEAAAANTRLASSFQEVTVGATSTINASAAARVELAALSGSAGAAEFGLARIAGQSKLLAPIIRAAFPVFAVLAFIEILDQAAKKLAEWADQEQKSADANAAFAREMLKSVEALDKAKEQLAGLSGHAAEAAVELAHAGDKTVDLSENVKKLNERLADQPGFWRSVESAVGTVAVGAYHLFDDAADRAEKSNELFNRQLSDTVKQTKDLPGALAAVTAKIRELQTEFDNPALAAYSERTQEDLKRQIDLYREWADSISRVIQTQSTDETVTRERTAKEIFSSEQNTTLDLINLRRQFAEDSHRMNTLTAEDTEAILLKLNDEKTASLRAGVGRDQSLLSAEKVAEPKTDFTAAQRDIDERSRQITLESETEKLRIHTTTDEEIKRRDLERAEAGIDADQLEISAADRASESYARLRLEQDKKPDKITAGSPAAITADSLTLEQSINRTYNDEIEALKEKARVMATIDPIGNDRAITEANARAIALDAERETAIRELRTKTAEDIDAAESTLTERRTTRNIKAAQEEAAAIEATFRKMGEQRDAAGQGHAGIFLEEAKTNIAEKQLGELDTQIAKTDDAIKVLKTDIANIKPGAGGIFTEAEIKSIDKYYEEIRTLEKLLQTLQTEHTKLKQTVASVWQDIHKAEEQAVSTFFTTFNSQFVKMMETGQSFSKVMISAWNSMVASFVTAVLKMGEQWVATEILKLETTQTTNATITATTLTQNLVQRFDNAKTAASKAMASTPFPLDLAVGPLVFAAALAFQQGGVVPGMGAVPAIVHGGEMVLPSHISSGIQNMISGNSTTSNRSSSANINMENHFHNQSDLSPSTVARLVMKGARQGKVGIRL